MQSVGSKLPSLRCAANSLKCAAEPLTEPLSNIGDNGASRSFWVGRCARKYPVVREVVVSDPWMGSSFLRNMVETMHQDMKVLREDFWTDFHSVKRAFDHKGFFGLRARVAETDQHYKLVADIPGVPRENVKVKLSSEGELEIHALRGHSATPQAAGAGANAVAEQVPASTAESQFRFRSLFKLPPEVDREAIRASVKDGVLEVTLPKVPTPQAAVKEIEVAAA